MDTLLLLLRLGLAIVLAVAGIAKLLDLSGSVSAVRAFGVPDRIAGLAGICLPAVETAIAIGLIPIATAPVAAAAAFVLMGVFVAGIAANLARGKRPNCHCFGNVHSAPIGWSTLARNGALAVASLTVATLGPGPSLVHWLRDLGSSGQALLAMLLGTVGCLAWQSRTIAHLANRAATLTSRLDDLDSFINGHVADRPGLAPGSAAPGFALEAIGRGRITLDHLRAAGKPVLLVFTEPTCSVCTSLMPGLGTWSRDLADSLTIAVLSSGPEAAIRRKTERHGLPWVLMQENHDLTVAYRLPGVPSAVLLDRDGLVTGQLASGGDAIRVLLQDLASQSRPVVSTRDHHPVGVPSLDRQPA